MPARTTAQPPATRLAEPVVAAIAFGPFRLDLSGQQLKRGSKPIALRRKSWQVLRCLAEHPGALLSGEQIHDAVWPDTALTPNVLTNVIGELRRALGDSAAAPKFIETVHRRGYRFIAALQSTEGAPATALKLDATPTPAEGPLIARDAELAQLLRLWRPAEHGERQTVFVTGEPGIGKTTLIDATLQRLRAAGTRLAHAQCVERHGIAEPYLPLLDVVAQLGDHDGGELATLLRSHAPTWLAQIPWLAAPDEIAALRASLGGVGPARMLREGVALFEALAHRAPLALVIEDLHWADASTVDLLAALARRSAPCRLLICGSYRPVDALVHGHPIVAAVQRLRQQQRCTDIALTPFAVPDVERYLATEFAALDSATRLAHAIEEHSGGNPLFVKALLAHLVARRLLRRNGRRWVVDAEVDWSQLGLPDSLRALIDAQFAGLSTETRAMLDAASVAGIEFGTHAIAAAVATPPERAESACDALARRGHLLRALESRHWPDGSHEGRYAFSHAVYRQALYDALPPLRRQRLHQRIGERLEAACDGDVADASSQLAWHFSAARDSARSVTYFALAAQRAAQRFAYGEAAARVRDALGWVERLDDSPARVTQEASLHLHLGNLLAIGSLADTAAVAHAFARAAELYAQLDEPRELARALLGMCAGAMARGAVAEAVAFGERLVTMTTTQLPALASVARYYLATALLMRGDLRRAHALVELDEVVTDTRVPAFLYLESVAAAQHATVLTFLGFVDQAAARLQRALTLSASLTSPFNRMQILTWAGGVYMLQRQRRAAAALAKEALALGRANGFTSSEAASRLHYAAVSDAPTAQRVRAIRRAMADRHALGERWSDPVFYAELAAALRDDDQCDAALHSLDEATELVDGGQAAYAAEVQRVRGTVLMKRGDQAAAEQCFRQAMQIAADQGARLYELRAALSCADLLRRQGQLPAARRLIRPLYATFNEGASSPDLQEAAALLASPPR